MARGDGQALIARGLGRSYGDAATNREAGVVDDDRPETGSWRFDETTGTLTAEAGVSYADLVDVLLPRGWFPLVTPGTKFVTLGGAIAADVHGKNHHRDGSFNACVQSFTLLTPAGELLDCSRDQPRRCVLGDAGRDGPDRLHPDRDDQAPQGQLALHERDNNAGQ